MIEGLQIDLSSEELKTQLTSRADYHKEKAEFYKKQVEDFRKAHESLAPELQYSNTMNSPVNNLEAKVEEHQKKSSIFSFMSEHLVLNETYRLSENDLNRLEIISRYF